MSLNNEEPALCLEKQTFIAHMRPLEQGIEVCSQRGNI